MKAFTFNNGDMMPMLGLGTWKSSTGEVYRAVREAIRIGYRHIDCATRYENEAEVGQAIADEIRADRIQRNDLWITSKLWNNRHRRHQVLPQLEETLRELGLDYLDLYLIHWPVALKEDIIYPGKPEDFLSLEEVPIAETWQGMEACLEKGLCRHIGVSNFSIKKLDQLCNNAAIMPEMNQIELHPLLQQNDMLEYCGEKGIFITAYSPLGSLDRPDRVKRADDPILLENPVIKRIAADLGFSPAQILISWALHRDTAVIPKSANPQRLRENFEARNIELSSADMEAISGLDRHFRYIHGEFWTMEGSPYTLESLWDEG